MVTNHVASEQLRSVVVPGGELTECECLWRIRVV